MSHSKRPLAPTIALACVGLTLTGCLYIPSGYTTQANGKPRPESIIGKDARSPIVLGQTPMTDALPKVLDQIAGLPEIDPRQLFDPRSMMASQPFAALTDWRYFSLNADRRQVAIPYRLKTATILYPWAVTPKTNSRLLVLTSDANGLVIAKDTIEPGDLAKRGLKPLGKDSSELPKLLETLLRNKLGDLREWLPFDDATR